MKTSLSFNTISGLSKKVITVWQGSRRGEVGQAKAMGLFPGREDQPLTVWSQHRHEQP